MGNEQTIERIKQYRAYVLRIVKLHNDIDYLARRSAPRNNLTAQLSGDKDGHTSPARPDAVNVLSQINNKRIRILELEWLVERMESSFALLTCKEREVLIMKYIDGWHVNAIAEYFGYASRQSVYSLLNRAVTNFSQIMHDSV